jgi:hypothetical protein
MKAADLDKLANLVRICGFLMQTKTYLFWSREQKWALREIVPLRVGFNPSRPPSAR